MNTMIIIYGVFAVFALAFGFFLAMHVTKSLRTHSEALKRLNRAGAALPVADHRTHVKARAKQAQSEGSNHHLSGSVRTSNCLSLPTHGAIRHVNGGYIRGYRVELQASLLANEHAIENIYDRLKQLLASDKPAGTLIQYRFANHTDPGYAVHEHRAAQAAPELTYPPARALHEYAVKYYEDLAATNQFRRPMLSVWVYVPMKHRNDHLHNGMAATMRRIKNDFSVARAAENLRSAYKAGSDVVIRRLQESEQEAFEQAEKVFRQIESGSPLKMTRLSQSETWAALYMGHNENAQIPPTYPTTPLMDLRDYLCGETIEGDGWYLLHGRTPVSIISLFAPPEPGSFAGIMRGLTSNPALTGRHTIVSEYIQLDRDKSKKGLKSRSKRIIKSSVKASGGVKLSADNLRAFQELEHVQMELTNSGEALTQLRFFVIVYGTPVQTQSQLKASVKQLEIDCENIITAIKRSMPGADPAREEPAALRTIYPSTIIGEMEPFKKTGREIEEVCDSLAALIPAEAAWDGTTRPHTLLATVTGKLIGLNFFQNKYTASPVGIVLGGTGSGKSVFMARTANDVLATLPLARVVGVDFGESLGPLVDVVGGRHLRFVLGETRAINIWDYVGLEEGVMPDEEQINLVVEDLLKLARVNPERESAIISESILKTCVKDVYADEVPNNQPNWPKHEPVHSHLLQKLGTYPFPEHQKRVAQDLKQILEDYRKHPWLDAPTHHDYENESPLDVYELDSLEKFPKDVRESLAFRVYARVIRAIGMKVGGELTPTLLIFDEMHKIVERYPDIMRAIKKGARQGRKENVVTLLGTQSYEDLKLIHDITANAGIKIIGKQIGNYDGFIKDAQWSQAAAGAISNIRNIAGLHAHYVISFGSGSDQQIELVQVDLGSVELWTFTTAPAERNARARVARLVPYWNMGEIVMWLAAKYPHGLIFAELESIDETLLAPYMTYRELPAMQTAELDTGEPEYATAATAAADGDGALHQEWIEAPTTELMAANENDWASADEVDLAKEGLLDALSNFIDDRDAKGTWPRRTSQQHAARAAELGIDIPGVIIIDPEESDRSN